jgi:flagellar motor switch protein FliN/FliY
MSTEHLSFADDLAAVFCSVARQTLKTALGRSCNLQVGERLPGNPAATPISLRFTLAARVGAEVALLLKQETAAILADLMMMGDGTAPWSDEHQDALQELGNQIAGAISNNQTERWGERLTFKATVEEGAPGPDATSYPIDLDIQGFPVHPFLLAVSRPLQDRLVELEDAKSSQSDFPKPDDFTEGLTDLIDRLAPPSKTEPEPLFGGLGGHQAPSPTSRSQATAGNTTSWIDSNDPSVQRLLDVPIEVTIELGQTELSIRRILEIGPGSIIELDRMAGEPVDLVVNDKVIAQGEVVVIEENFGIRITHLVTPEERARPLR